MAELPRITVIVPCRNEKDFIRQCLDSIIQNDYPHDRLEILVVDGVSEDGTWSIIVEFVEKYSLVRGLHNPQLITPMALNLGIANACGEIIIRVDAHATIASDYLRLCVQMLIDSGADNVGGAMQTIPLAGTLIASAIAAGISHPFGVGNSRFRASTKSPTWVDTVFGGCYRKDVFQRVGLFNEDLPRGQDMEFNRRLQDAGGKILLDPRIKSSYFACPDLRQFWRHNFRDGEWAIMPFAFGDTMPIRWRHAVPLVFTVSMLVAAGLAIPFAYFRFLLLGILCVYLTASLSSSLQVALQKCNWRYFFLLPVVFAVRHFAYGFGSIRGIFRLAAHSLLSRNPSPGKRSKFA